MKNDTDIEIGIERMKRESKIEGKKNNK